MRAFWLSLLLAACADRQGPPGPPGPQGPTGPQGPAGTPSVPTTCSCQQLHAVVAATQEDLGPLVGRTDNHLYVFSDVLNAVVLRGGGRGNVIFPEPDCKGTPWMVKPANDGPDTVLVGPRDTLLKPVGPFFNPPPQPQSRLDPAAGGCLNGSETAGGAWPIAFTDTGIPARFYALEELSIERR